MAEVTSFRNNALPYPVYGVAWAVVFPLLDADGDPVSPSSPDSERSLNGDTFADCTNEAVEIATSSGICYLLLTAAEMTADIVTVRIQSTGAKTTVITLYPRKLPVIATGTCQGANDTGDIQLASGDSAIDDYYNGCLIVAVIDSVTESRIINDYVGSTKVAEIAPAWNTAAPDSNDTYTIYLPEGRQVSPVNVTHAAGVAWASGAITAAVIATDAIDADAIADNAINAAAIAADAITDAKVASDVTIASVTGSIGSVATGGITAGSIAADAIGASELAADAIAEIADAVWDEDATGHQTQGTFGQAIGDPVADTNTIFKATVTDASGATVGVDGASIKTVTDQFAFGTANRVDAQVYGIEANAITDAAIAADAITQDTFAAGAISAAAIDANAISASKLDTDVSVEIADQVTAQVWNEPTSGHTTAGTTGKALTDAGSAGDPWSTALPGAYSAGSAGKIVGDNINATISSRSSHSAADVWAVGTRTLSSFGTLVADIATAVWAAATRTLSAFGFTPDTNVVNWKGSTAPAMTGDAFARLGAPVGASISADIAAAKTDITADTEDLQSRLPAALTAGGNIKADALAIDGSATAADRLQRSAEAIAVATVGSGSTTTSIVTSAIDPAATVADQFKGRIVIFDKATTTAALRGQATDITASTSGGVLTVTALTTAPASGDTFTIT